MGDTRRSSSNVGTPRRIRSSSNKSSHVMFTTFGTYSLPHRFKYLTTKRISTGVLVFEALVSAQVTRLVRRMKVEVEHSRSIVQMQHHLSDEQLAAYARRNSLQPRERAQELAAGNWEILP